MDGKLCPLDESGGKGEGLHSSLDELECVLGGCSSDIVKEDCCLSDIVKEDGCSIVGWSSSRDFDGLGYSHEGM